MSAGCQRPCTHTGRHTGNFALQRILGHESLTMVNNYLVIAQTDIQAAHTDVSPVTNWCL